MSNKCWEKDDAKIYEHSGICKHYGRYSGLCLREDQEEFKPCEFGGKQEVKKK